MISDFQYLAFPGLLLAYYIACWLAVGRDPKIENVAPQYEPPLGVSPGVARYITTGGSDGTTLAAVLAGLAAKGVVSIQPQNGSYAVRLLNSKVPVLPDEASAVRTLFSVEQAVQPYAASNTSFVGTASRQGPDSPNVAMAIGPSGQHIHEDAIFGDDIAESSVGVAVERQPQPHGDAVLDPSSATEIKYHLDALQDTFRKNLQGIYFQQNFIFAGIGIVATFAWGLFVALTLNASSSVFITFWLLLFTSLSGLVIGGVWTSKPTHPSLRQRVMRMMLPVLFLGLPGAMIYLFALPEAHSFVLALLLAVLFNNVFFVIMRAPTSRGLAVLKQLAGFREFLVRVEQDRLDRINSPEQRAELMDRFLPYAIALNVRGGWGDKMAAAFSDSIVER